MGLLTVAETLPQDVTPRTTRLQELIKAIPEPPPPPADEDAELPDPATVRVDD